MDEINLIEVELLGREHYERMERERLRAEETGLAQLKRLQEHELQTRMKYNKAKHQYYFPKEKGFNITFGGGGIFGACKDICISEIHGNLKIVAEPGEFGSKGPITPARVIVTFQAATKSDGKESSKTADEKLSPRKPERSEPVVNKGETMPVGNSPTKEDLQSRQEQYGASDSESSSVTLEMSVEETPDRRSDPGEPPKGFAKRFLRRLGRKKEKYQSGRDPSQLDPLPEECEVNPPTRSLAKKLLSRRGGKGSKKNSNADLDGLSFRGNRLYTSDSNVGPQSIVDDLESVDSFISDQVGDSMTADVDNSFDADKGSQFQDQNGHEYHDMSRKDSPLTRESLQRIEQPDFAHQVEDAPGPSFEKSTSKTSRFASTRTASRGSWLLDSVGSDSHDVFDDEMATTVEVDDPDIQTDEISEGEKAIGGMQGVYCNGRLSGFELIGEKGSKVPNLTIGNADVSATVFVKFVFEYDKDHGWRPGQKPQDRPKFHVEKLKYTIEGNNVPMPPTLIKHILRVAIPGLIQRRLLLLLPKELGEYVQTARRGFTFDADVGLVGPALSVLDVDIGFEITGPEKSEKAARKQQAKFEASKEARNMLGLSLPQAQILSELFGGRYALMQPPRVASISNLIAFKAKYEAHPKLFEQLCTVINAAYHIFAKNVSQTDVSEFSFKEFMDVAVTRVRKKPAKARVIVRNIDISVNADAVVTAIHDFTQRAIEELVIKGPMSDPSATLESMRESIAEDLDVLHAWHVFALRELEHFKSKFKTAGGTVLLAADKNGLVAGIENSHYEGPLRLRLPVSVPLDQDGAISFEIPLPSPAGSLGVVRTDKFRLNYPDQKHHRVNICVAVHGQF